MNESNASVAIVIDPNFGERLALLATQMPVWIADTPVNRTCAESLWSRCDSQRPAVTTFGINGDDAAEWCRAILPQIELHHGEYSQSPAFDSIEVFGARPTPNLRDALSNMALQYRPNARTVSALSANHVRPNNSGMKDEVKRRHLLSRRSIDFYFRLE